MRPPQLALSRVVNFENCLIKPEVQPYFSLHVMEYNLYRALETAYFHKNWFRALGFRI
jgi:hypothetical protein